MTEEETEDATKRYGKFMQAQELTSKELLPAIGKRTKEKPHADDPRVMKATHVSYCNISILGLFTHFDQLLTSIYISKFYSTGDYLCILAKLHP
jgi:hypothetical protein